MRVGENRILQQIGPGDMGIVDLFEQPDPGRSVAVEDSGAPPA